MIVSLICCLTLALVCLLSAAAHIPASSTSTSSTGPSEQLALLFPNNLTVATSPNTHNIHLTLLESHRQAAIHARELIHYRSEGIGTLISSYADDEPDDSLRSLPIGLQEYFAPYPDGDLVLLVLPISPIYRNILGDSRRGVTLAIQDELGTIQRKGMMWSANRRRLSVMGRLSVLLSEREQREAQKLYEEMHPDSRMWDGPDGPHGSFWARLVVEKVFYFGGFGDRAAIGWIPPDLYRHAGFTPSPEARRQAICFHPKGINLYCDQPVDADDDQQDDQHSAHHVHHHHHHHHHHHYHSPGFNQSSLESDDDLQELEAGKYLGISELEDDATML